MKPASFREDRARIAEVVATTTLIQIMATATMLALTPIAPRAAEAFGTAAHAVGYQISLIYIFGAVGSAFAGSLVERFGAIRIEQISLMLFSAGLLGLASANLWLGAAASALIGIGYGVQNPASSQILTRIVPAQRRNMIFSIKQAGVPLGGALASIGLPLLDKAAGWRTGFVLLALLPAALALYLRREARDPVLCPPAKPPSGPIRAEMRRWLMLAIVGQKRALQRPFLALSLLTLFYSSVQLTVSTFLVLMLVQDRGWPLVSAAAIAATVQIAGAFGRIGWGVAGDRAGNGMAVLGLIGTICTLALLSLPFAPDMPGPLLILLLCTLGATASGWNGVAMAEIIHRCDPHEAGAVTGAVLVYTFIGVVVGPSLFALLYGWIGAYGSTMALFALGSGLGAALAFTSALRQRPSPSA